MIAVDTNVLVYAHVPAEQYHQAAVATLRRLSESGDAWGVPAPCLAEFVRVLTHPRVYAQSGVAVAAAVRHLAGLPGIRVLHGDETFVEALCVLCSDHDATGNKSFDAQITAICAANHVGSIVTADRGFVTGGLIEVARLC